MEPKKNMARRKNTIARSTRFAPTFESLEPRQLLAANVLANGILEDVSLTNAGDTHTLQLEVTANKPVILAFDMQGQNGLNPGQISIQSVSGHTIAPIASTNGSTSSMFLAELGTGSYEITVLADGGTIGSYDFSVSLVGDLDQTGKTTGDGIVTTFEQMWTQAAIAQSQGKLNSYTAAYYSQFGIPVGKNLYDINLDANRNGAIDAADYSCVTKNVGTAGVTVKLINDNEAPVIEADLVNDTGISGTDNISSDITITGSVTDKSVIATFKAGIDDMAVGSYVNILAKVGANGTFTLDRTALEAIAGGSLDDGQEHTLHLIAIDEHTNGLGDTPYTITFTLDTQVLTQPTQDLSIGTDTDPDGDLYTEETTVTIEGVADPNTKLTLLKTGATTTSDASGNYSFTGVAFAYGDNAITIRAESALGGSYLDSTVTYTQNNTPTLKTFTPAQYTENDGAKYINLNDVFTDLNLASGDSLTFEVLGNTNTTLFSSFGISSTYANRLAFTMEGTTSGTSTVTVRATDSHGKTVETSFDIVVTSVNDAPVATGLEFSTSKNESVPIDLWDYFTDEETAVADLVFGNVQCGSFDPEGTYTLREGHFVDFVPFEGRTGLATLSVTVTDQAVDGKAANTVTKLIYGTIANKNIRPVANDTSRTIDEDPTLPVEIAVGSLVSDLETPLADMTITILSSTGGTTEVVTVGGTRSFRFTPTANFNGAAGFTYKATDTGVDLGSGNTEALSDTGTVTITIDPVNDAPVAGDASRTISENGGPVEIAVASLVSDVETVLADLTISITSATGGTAEIVEIAGVKTFRFTPDTNYNGAAGFTYSVTDNGDGTAAAKTSTGTVNITINPVNDAPTANATSLTTTEDTVTVDLDLRDLVGDTETALDNLTFAISGETNGTVELVDGHIVRFTPSANFNNTRGSASFAYTVTDTGDNGAAALSTGPITITVSVTAVNDAPVAVSDLATVPIDQDSTIDVLANDSDPDNANGETDTLTLVSATIQAPVLGSVSIESGKIKYSPEPGATTQYSVIIDYIIEDGSGVQSTATLALTVTPNAPPVAVDDTGSTSENASLTTANVLSNDDDPEEDAISIIAYDSTSVKGIAVTLNANNTFEYDLSSSTAFDYLAVGETVTDTFTYTISDGNGGTDTATVTITITGVNDTPVAVDDGGFTVSENGSVGGNVLTNDSDPDTSDTLTVTSNNVTSAKGVAVTVNANGSFTYNLSSSTAFDYLGAGETTTDTFTYTISDGHGGTDTATVTITVNGVNDAPVGTNDSSSTVNDTAIDINVLANDSDVDSASLNVTNLQATTAQGATVTINTDGTLHYDPTTSTALQALASGQHLTDTFTYTANDGSLDSQTVTVTIVVSGFVNTAPQVDSPIADITLENGDDQPALIDLTSVFSDVDGHNLSFTAASSNSELVQVDIVNGTQLQVTYLAYTTGQDRTPATIIVTATESDSGESLSVSDSFTVTVNPIETVEFFLIIRDTATDTVTATKTTTLPTSISTVDVGSTYVVEIWAINTYYNTSSVAGTGSNVFLSTARGDLGFDKTLGLATALNYAGPFDSFTEGVIDNVNGVVDSFGGANMSHDDVGVSPNYSRIGYVTFEATATGTQDFDFNVEFAGMWSVGSETDASQITVHEASVTHVTGADTYTYNLQYNRSYVEASGTIAGNMLDAMTNSDTWVSNSTSGSLTVTYDDFDSASEMTILSGNLDLNPQNSPPDGTVRPGIGGTNGSAVGDLALQTSTIEIAVRNLEFGFVSNSIHITGASFDPSEIQVTITSGTIDYLTSSGNGGTIDLTNRTVIDGGEANGLHTSSNIIEIFNRSLTIDLSDIFGSNSQITFTLFLEANYDSTAPIMGTASAEDTPTDVALSVVKTPTATNAKGEVAEVPHSETWIDEWDSHWVEIWVKTEEGSGVSSANVDLAYNAEYFTATEIEYSPAVIGDFTGDILTDGIVSGFGGTFDSSGVGVDGYVLLGRVKFESLAGDGVELDLESFGTKPFDLGLELTVNDLDVIGVDHATVGVHRAPTTELWAMPYDTNDDDVINLADISQFVVMFQADVLSSDNPVAQVVDFNNDGKVDLADLSQLLVNYGNSKFTGIDVSFPETFTQRWIGSGLDTTGDSTAGELLDAATAMWQSLLGTDAPIDIQLVVTDLGGKQLAEAEILAVDENGQPIAGRITLDDDAAGLGWYSQIDGTPDAEMYDLYTVMLHEIGHTLGFMSSYDGFAVNLETVGGQVTFVDESISVTMDNAGNHVAGDSLSDDLMSSTLDPGVRKLPSDLDAQMILAAYEAAEGGASGFAAISAPITAAEAMATASIATTDLAQLDGPLAGEMTWDRLFDTRSEKNEETLEATDVWFAYESPEIPVVAARSESESDWNLNDELEIELVEELTAETTSEEVVDGVFDDWNEMFML